MDQRLTLIPEILKNPLQDKTSRSHKQIFIISNHCVFVLLLECTTYLIRRTIKIYWFNFFFSNSVQQEGVCGCLCDSRLRRSGRKCFRGVQARFLRCVRPGPDPAVSAKRTAECPGGRRLPRLGKAEIGKFKSSFFGDFFKSTNLYDGQ